MILISNLISHEMGNAIYAKTLIGMSIKKAEKFIKENIVYFDADHTKYRIMEIRPIYSYEYWTIDCRHNRLNVEVEGKCISNIISTS